MAGPKNLNHLPQPGERILFKDLFSGYIFKADSGGYYVKTRDHWYDLDSTIRPHCENVFCFILGLKPFYGVETELVTVVGHYQNHNLSRLFDQYLETGGKMETEFEVDQWVVLEEDRNNLGAFQVERVTDSGIHTDYMPVIPFDNCRHARPSEIGKAKEKKAAERLERAIKARDEALVTATLEAERKRAERASKPEFEVGQWAIKKGSHGFSAFKIDSIELAFLSGTDELYRHATPVEIDTAKEKAANERLERASAEKAAAKPDNFNTGNEDDRPPDPEVDKMVSEITNLRDYQRHAVAVVRELKTSLEMREYEVEHLTKELEEARAETPTMGRGNYRVVKRNCKATREEEVIFFYGIYETYYDSDGQPDNMSKGPDGPEEESVADLRETLENMLKALDKPVLNYDEIGE